MFVISDLPPELPVNEVRMYCSVEAAVHYAMPADLIFAVALNEGGRSDSKVKNTNGTFDLGAMQFNTAYLKTLESQGIKSSDVMKSGCYPFHLAAWRIKGHLEEEGSDVFTKVANYHSRTPKYNVIYKNRLIKNIQKFDYALGEHYFNLVLERMAGANVK